MTALSYISIKRSGGQGRSTRLRLIAHSHTHYVQHSIGFFSVHHSYHRFGDLHPRVSDGDSGSMGRLPLAPLRPPQDSGGRSVDRFSVLKRLSRLVALVATVGAFLVPQSVFATPPVILDYQDTYTGTYGLEDDINDDAIFGFKWVPIADTGLCEISIPLKKQSGGGTTSAYVELDVIASPSNATYYSWEADSTLDWDLIGTSYSDKVFTFYNDIHATNGTCPVLYGGHEYRIRWTFRRDNGTDRIYFKPWSDNFSQYTTVFNTSGELEASGEHEVKAWGYGAFTFPHIPGSTEYETADPVEWTTIIPSLGFSLVDLTGAGSFCNSIASPSDAFGIPYGLCYISGFLLIPSGTAINDFVSNISVVKEKVPISYLVELQGIWATVSSTSQSIPTMGVPLNIFGASTSSMVILSSASWTRWVSTGTLSSLRGISTVALWFGFAFYAWRRGRHLLRHA